MADEAGRTDARTGGTDGRSYSEATMRTVIAECGFADWSKEERLSLKEDLKDWREFRAAQKRRTIRRKALTPVLAFSIPAVVTLATWIGSSLASHPVYINYTPPIVAPTPTPSSDQP